MDYLAANAGELINSGRAKVSKPFGVGPFLRSQVVSVSSVIFLNLECLTGLSMTSSVYHLRTI